MKRVLILAYTFPPQGGTGTIRVAKFVRYLPEFGWEPVVVCSQGDWNRDDSLLREVPAGTEVQRVAWPRPVRALWAGPAMGSDQASSPGRSQPGAGVRRVAWPLSRLARGLLVPDRVVPWVPGAARRCARIIAHEQIDALLTTTPPHSVQLAGYWLKRRFPRLPWVADYRDLWSQSHLVVGRPGYRLNHWLERACLQRANRVLVVTEGIRRLTLERFPALPGDKIVTLTNGYDPLDLGDLPPHQPNARFTMSFVGSLYEARSTEFVPALDELMADQPLRDRMRVRFVGIIPQAIRQQLQPLCEMGVASVKPLVPRREALAEMVAADVLLLLESDIPETRVNHSNKLFEYLATGHPILAVAGEGEITRLVRQAGAGLSAHPADRAQIKAAILELFHRFEQGTLAGAVPGEGYPQYQRRNLTRELAQVLDECAGALR